MHVGIVNPVTTQLSALEAAVFEPLARLSEELVR